MSILLKCLFLIAAACLALPGHAQAGDVHAKAPQSETEVELVETLAIGGPDAADPAQFYEKFLTTQVDADADGNIYVLDMGNNRVQVFSPTGAYLRTVGQEGGGPGEFKLPNKLSVNADGMVAVFDMGQQRLSIFDATGKLARDQVMSGMVEGIALQKDGSVICMYEGMNGVEMERFDAAGKSAWRIGEYKEMAEMNVMKFGAAPMGPGVVTGPDGTLYRMHDGEYRLGVISADGSPSGNWGREFERVAFKLPSGDGDEEGGENKMVFVTVTEESDGAGGGSGPEVSWSDKGHDQTVELDQGDLMKHMPEFRADLRGVLAWPDGRIWAVTATEKDDHLVVDEWTAAGEYARRLTLPGRYDWLQVGADGNLYGVGHDEDDYPIVYRLQVENRL